MPRRMKSFISLWILSFVIIVNGLSPASQKQCGVIGTNAEEAQESRQHGLYLNTQHPATCNGTVEQFQYCYYGPEQAISRSTSYHFTFAVFRETSPGITGSTYTAVSPAFTTTQTSSEFNNQRFSCVIFSVPDTIGPIEIMEGDVIGACIYDPPNNDGTGRDRLQLDVVGDSMDTSDFLMLGGNSECDDDMVPNRISASSLNRKESLVLHLQASIAPLSTGVPPATATMGTTIPPTESTTEATQTPAETTVGTTQPPIDTTIPETSMSELTTTEAPDISVPSTSTSASSTTEGTSVTTVLLEERIEPEEDIGMIAAVTVAAMVILLIVIVGIITILLIVARRRKIQRRKNPPSIVDGIDNVIYSPTQRNSTTHVDTVSIADYSTIRSRGTTHSEIMGHTYETASTHQPFLGDYYYYGEVRPIQDNSLQSEYLEPVESHVSTMSYRELLEMNIEENIYGRENAYQAPASQEDEIYAQLKTWGVQYIHKKDVEALGHIGSGQFGSVEQGVWKRQGTKPVDVALKSLTKTSEEDKVKFLQEAAIMAQFRHPNVIMLHGMVAKGESLMLVVELAKRGDLRNVLLSIKQDESEIAPSIMAPVLLKCSQQVALGMQYLSAKGFVHRDLAARNVLVTNTNVCKVADFGMSRDLADETYYVSQAGGKIPVKWTAPEAIHYKKYSTASDVWSYGCLLYEIWSLGHKPFGLIRNIDVINIIDRGTRLASPPGCSRTMYELMINCWHPNTTQRPSFRDIVLTLVGSEEMVLNIPEEDSSTNPLAGVLGAPLEAGENMYSELQTRYI